MGTSPIEEKIKDHYLNVLFCGEDYFDYIPSFPDDINNTRDYCEFVHENTGWNYYLFSGFQEEKLSSIKILIERKCSMNNKRECNNVIVCKIDQLLNEMLLSLIRVLSKIVPSINQPRVLILTQLKDTEDQMRRMIKEANIHYDTEEIIKVSITPNNPLTNLFYHLYQASCFLNQLGDEHCFPINYNYTEIDCSHFKIIDKEFINRFNILLIGKSGSGKSTFINNTYYSKRSLARKGMKVTQEMIQYKHKNEPIAIYDTPGIESEQDTKIILKALQNFSEKQTKNNKDPIHLILFFINSQSTLFNYYTLPFIEKLAHYQIRIYFILTHCSNSIAAFNARKFTVDSLKTIRLRNPQIIFVDQNNSFFDNSNNDNHIYHDNGLKAIYLQIFNDFSQYKYTQNQISLFSVMQNDQNILEIIKSSFFFKNINQKDDLLNKASKEAIICLFKNLFVAMAYYLLSKIPEIGVFALNLFDETSFVISVANCYNIKLKPREARTFIKSINLDSIAKKIVSLISKEFEISAEVSNVLSNINFSKMNVSLGIKMIVEILTYFKKFVKTLAIIEFVYVILLGIIKLLIIFLFLKNKMEIRFNQKEGVKDIILQTMQCFNDAVDYFFILAQ